MTKERELLKRIVKADVADYIDIINEAEEILAQPEQSDQEPLSDDGLYYERMKKKVDRMKKEWIEYNLTDQLINDFFACARKELADEGADDE